MRQLRAVAGILYVIAFLSLLAGLVGLFVIYQPPLSVAGIAGAIGAGLLGLTVDGLASVAERVINLLTVTARAAQVAKKQTPHG